MLVGWRSWRGLQFRVQGFNAQVDELPISLNQRASMTFLLDETDVTKQLLAILRRFRILADRIDHCEHVQQHTGIVATCMAKHIEGGAEQFIEGNRLEHKAKPTIPVVVMGAFLTLPDEQRQAIPHVIQARHRGEGVVDRRRHGSDSHFDELVDSVFDVLSGHALVSNLEGMANLFLQLLIHSTGRPDQGNHFATADKVTRLVQQADDQIPFLYQGQHVLRIDVLDVPGAPHTNRRALCLQQGIGRFLVILPLVITAPDLIRDLRTYHVQQLCTSRGRDIGGLSAWC